MMIFDSIMQGSSEAGEEKNGGALVQTTCDCGSCDEDMNCKIDTKVYNTCMYSSASRC